MCVYRGADVTIDVDLLPRLTVVLGGVALLVLVYALWREYRRRPTKPIAVDHDHNHHGLIWTLLILMLLGICGPGSRQGPPGPQGPAGPPGPSGKPATTP